MSWIDGVRHRLREALQPSRLDDEFDEEMADHAAREASRQAHEGLVDDAARRRARLRTGSLDAAREAAADGRTVTAPEEPKDVRIDLPVDAHLPVDYIGSDRLRLEAYRRLAAASGDDDIAGVVAELTDRYGQLPEPAQRLVEVARLRLLCRQYGVTEVSATGAATVRVSPLTLPGLTTPGQRTIRGVRRDSSYIQRLSNQPCSPR